MYILGDKYGYYFEFVTSQNFGNFFFLIFQFKILYPKKGENFVIIVYIIFKILPFIKWQKNV